MEIISNVAFLYLLCFFASIGILVCCCVLFLIFIPNSEMAQCIREIIYDPEKLHDTKISDIKPWSIKDANKTRS